MNAGRRKLSEQKNRWDRGLDERKTQEGIAGEWVKEWWRRGEERKGVMNRRLRGGLCFDLEKRALVFTFNTAEGISLSFPVDHLILPFQLSITMSHNLPHPEVSVLTRYTSVFLFLICYLQPHSHFTLIMDLLWQICTKRAGEWILSQFCWCVFVNGLKTKEWTDNMCIKWELIYRK